MPRGQVNNSPPAPNLAIKKLEQLLESRHMTYADLARQLKINRATITHWRQGSTPRRNRMNGIAAWSSGSILPKDWLESP